MPCYDEHFTTSLHRLRDFALFLPNPTFANTSWQAASLHALVVRLSPFADVERSTPHLFLAREVRAAFPSAYVDFAFLPCAEDARTMEAAGVPVLVGTQSRRSLSDFDVVLVSNSWVLEQVNLPWLLAHSAVPLWASERGEQWPPIVVGGSNSRAAQALVSESGDCMADALFFGEGEGRVRALVAALARTGAPKRERLAGAARQVEGLWLAGDLSARARKAACSDIASMHQAGPAPILPGGEAATARLSITQGCPCLCSFCFEGHERKPFRELPAADILREAEELKRVTGADTLEIDSFNFNTHSEIARLLVEMNRVFHRVNLMSQRVDILARTPGLLALETSADKRSFTLGIEGISEARRRFLHKSLSEKEIHAALEALHQERTRELKLFFILTGRESAADFQELADLVRWLKHLRARMQAPPRTVFSFGMLVRMPFTPLRHDPPVLEESQWRQVVGKAKSICETNGFEFRLAMAWPQYAATQLLALGNHDVHGLLEFLARAGEVTARGLSQEATAEVTRWISRAGEPAEKPLGHPFAFAFLDDPETQGSLHQQYEDAKAGKDSGYCRRGDELCSECPGCTRVPARRAGRELELSAETRALRELMERKHKLKPIHVAVRLPPEAAGLGSRWAEAWLMRRLFDEHPEQLGNVLAIRESLVDASEALGAEVPWFGKTVAAVWAWDTKSLDEALGRPLTGFTAGQFRALRARVILPREPFADAADHLAAFLRDSYAPVTLSRARGVTKLRASGKTLKKKMLLDGVCEETDAEYRFELSIGPHPFLGQWLASFGGRDAARRARVEVLQIDAEAGA